MAARLFTRPCGTVKEKLLNCYYKLEQTPTKRTTKGKVRSICSIDYHHPNHSTPRSIVVIATKNSKPILL
jgi:hypothetical protein